jgi:hypothetical protein
MIRAAPLLEGDPPGIVRGMVEVLMDLIRGTIATGLERPQGRFH